MPQKLASCFADSYKPRCNITKKKNKKQKNKNEIQMMTLKYCDKRIQETLLLKVNANAGKQTRMMNMALVSMWMKGMWQAY